MPLILGTFPLRKCELHTLQPIQPKIARVLTHNLATKPQENVAEQLWRGVVPRNSRPTARNGNNKPKPSTDSAVVGVRKQSQDNAANTLLRGMMKQAMRRAGFVRTTTIHAQPTLACVPTMIGLARAQSRKAYALKKSPTASNTANKSCAIAQSSILPPCNTNVRRTTLS